MNLKITFCPAGLIVFVLPMIINVFYALFPPAGESGQKKKVSRWAEITENVSRIAYLLVLTFVKSENPLDYRNAFLYIAAAFLVLYYVVWIRYFCGGRKVDLLGKPFLFVPIPLAVFPVLYYIFAAIWLNNLPAAGIMVVFGVAHIIVSAQSFKKN